MRFLAWVCALTIPVFSAYAAVSTETVPATPQYSAHGQAFSLVAPPFEFHSGFWINLHHYLYLRGLPSTTARFSPLPSMSGSDRKKWDEAVTFYREHIVQRDFVSDEYLWKMDAYLAKMESAPTLSGEFIGNAAANALMLAAPIYNQYWWPRHDAANRFWIELAHPLVMNLAEQMRLQVTNAYEAEWPATMIRVDVSVYANWGGAYTNTEDSGLVHTVMSSTEAGYRGVATLEMLFHEASHAMVDGETGKLGEAINAQAKAHGIVVPEQLWHALIFYTTGEFARRDLDRVGVRDYEPYAAKQDLWARGWQDYRSVLELFWQAHMDGHLSLDEAMSKIMSALAVVQAKPDPVRPE